MKPTYYYLCLLLFAFSCSEKTKTANTPTPLSEEGTRLPENALQGLSLGEGVQAQLFAAEPLVRNPSNIDIDHRGRVWVVENVNYRPENNPDNPYQEGGDMIVILEDTDGDGQADDRKVFFHDLLVDGAMGIGVMDNKVYLSSSPHILVLTDEDRDDKADRIDTLFTGMGGKQGDHNVHAVTFGPDGRLYFNFGNGSPEMLYKDGSPVIDKMGNVVKGTVRPYQHGMVFRCEQDGSEVETLGHNFRNNYEVCVDSYGRMWQSDNDDDGHRSVRINYVMEYGNFGYRDEYTGEAWQVSRSGMHPDIPSRHWHQNDPGVVPNLFITGSGSPCGITFYEGKLLPKLYQNQLLHADAGPGKVRLIAFKSKGAGFSAEEHPILVRKADAWYRPTDVSVAPDGSVFASDWYDPGVGGHWAGDAYRGRIYRIAPTVDRYAVPEYAFDTPEAATDALKSPNTATRYLAWTALEKMGKGAESALLTLWDSKNPLFCARALWLLARLGKSHLNDALEDSDEQIRAAAIRVARQLYPENLSLILQGKVQDSSPKVRREVAIALREIDAPEEAKIWAELATQHDGKDRWYLEALGIGAADNWEACLEAYLDKVEDDWNSPAGRDIIWRSRAYQSWELVMGVLEDPKVPNTELARFLRATDFLSHPNKDVELSALFQIERKDQAEFQRMLLTHISPEFAQKSPQIQQAAQELLPPLRGTQEYLDLVDKLSYKNEREFIFQMAMEQPNHEMGVRSARILLDWEGWQAFEEAIQGEHKEATISLLKHINEGSGKELLKSVAIDEQSPMALRKKAIESLAFDWGWEPRVIKLLESRTLPEELIHVAAGKLLNAARPVDRAVGRKFLDEIGASQSTLPPLEKLVAQEGDIAQGKVVFSTYCIACHKVNGQGVAYGPDLSEIANKLGKDGLLSSIIYPDAAISHGFEGVQIELIEGTRYQGYLLSENASTLQLRVQDGSTQNLPQSDVKALTPMENSLMTPGLAQAMGEEDLVDLVSYLSSLSNQATMASNPYQGKIEYEREE